MLEDQLRDREDVDDAEIGVIVELAAQLQDQARAKARRLSASEVADIAEQLDIEADAAQPALRANRL
jgi:hypothetical protein